VRLLVDLVLRLSICAALLQVAVVEAFRTTTRPTTSSAAGGELEHGADADQGVLLVTALASTGCPRA
jgi:hypothetical protein